MKSSELTLWPQNSQTQKNSWEWSYRDFCLSYGTRTPSQPNPALHSNLLVHPRKIFTEMNLCKFAQIILSNSISSVLNPLISKIIKHYHLKVDALRMLASLLAAAGEGGGADCSSWHGAFLASLAAAATTTTRRERAAHRRDRHFKSARREFVRPGPD